MAWWSGGLWPGGLVVWRPGGLVIWLFYDLEISERAGAGQRERERERERWFAAGSSRCEVSKEQLVPGRAGAGQRERERERERWVARGSSRCANLGASRGGTTRARARALAVVTVLEPALHLEAAQIRCGCRDSFGAGCMP